MIFYLLFITLFLTCLTNIVFSECDHKRNLVAVVQIFRHGQRTPYHFYANDPYANASYWKGIDPGELTEEGNRQMYALGKFTRLRYKDWLPEEYSPSDFIVRTTNVRRAKLSAISNINGLYPTGRPRIPLYLADPAILMDHIPRVKECGYYFMETLYFVISSEALDVDIRFGEALDYMTEKSGNNISNVNDVHPLFDSLEIESSVGLPLPEWTEKIYPEPLGEMDGYYFDSFSHTPKQQRLTVGTWLNEVLVYLENMARDPSLSQKFQMYSAHDINLYAILNAFKAYSPTFRLDFAASIYIELRQTSKYHYVNVWLKNKGEFRQIHIRNCDFDCPLNHVRELLQEIIIDVPTKLIECDMHP